MMTISETSVGIEGSLIWTLEEINRLVSQSGKPAETLDNIVSMIQLRFETDVCSVYLLEPDRTHLVLAATVGLKPESVGRVRMRLDEGLAGLVAEQFGRRSSMTLPGIRVSNISRIGRGLVSLVLRSAAHRSGTIAGRAGRANARAAVIFGR